MLTGWRVALIVVPLTAICAVGAFLVELSVKERRPANTDIQSGFSIPQLRPAVALPDLRPRHLKPHSTPQTRARDHSRTPTAAIKAAGATAPQTKPTFTPPPPPPPLPPAATAPRCRGDDSATAATAATAAAGRRADQDIQRRVTAPDLVVSLGNSRYVTA